MKKFLFFILLLGIFQGSVFSQSFRDFEFSEEYNYPIEFISYYKDLVSESGILLFLSQDYFMNPLIESSMLSKNFDPSDPLVYILKLNPDDKMTPLAIFQKGLAYLISFKDKEDLTRIDLEDLSYLIENFFDIYGLESELTEDIVSFFYDFLSEEQIKTLLEFKDSN